MQGFASPPNIVRFGVFEVDLRAGELRKNGLKVRLQEKPFQVLEMLLERPGEIVTREELQKKLWPENTFVDFDHSMNTAVTKLREALGDTADNPRFVETLARRGYRFIAPVSGLEPVEGTTHPEYAGKVKSPVQQSQTIKKGGPRATAALALVCLALAVGGALAYKLAHPIAPPTVTDVTQLTHDGLGKGGIMVTDGARIYFSEAIAGHWTPAVVAIAGGDPRPISMPFQDANVLDVSPDGSELLVTRVDNPAKASELWAIPVLGGSPHRIGDIKASEATWSPDGQKILYLKENELNLYVAQSDGKGSHKLVTAPGSPYLIRWSPDGKRISLSVDDGKAATLWEVSADGSNLHPVLPTWYFPGAACSGHWTSDGRYLLFDSYRGGPDNIWAIRERGGFFERAGHEPTRLTAGPMEIGKPVASKDGKKVFVLGTLPRGELLRYDLKTRQPAPYLGGISARHLDFTRDGQWVAYVANPESSLWKSRVDGSQRLQLTFPPIQAYLPRWSPDGKSIAFSDRASSPAKMLAISAEGGNPESLAQDASPTGGNPSWSPDGKLLVYASGLPPEPQSLHLYDMETHQISKVAGSDGLYSPRWSPDGRYIAALTLDAQDLMLLDLRTQKWTAIAPRVFGWPKWSRDSKYIYFDNDNSADWIVYRVRIADRKLERLVSSKGIEPAGALEFAGVAPDDSVLVLRNVVSREIYALEVDFP